MIAGQRRQRPLGAADPRRPTAKRQGLSRLELAELVRRQLGACALCGLPLGPSYHVDHDHVVAKSHPHPVHVGCRRCFRGVLHTKCNAAIGFLNDDPELLTRAAAYVTRLRRTY